MYEKKGQDESLGTDAVVGSLKLSKHNESRVQGILAGQNLQQLLQL